MAFPEQREAILSPARQKAVLTPRRSGKTTTTLLDACYDQRQYPGAKYGLIALTRPSVEEIAWEPLKRIDRDFGLGCHFQEAKLRMNFPNGAQLSLFGADQSNWINRLRGPSRYRRWYVDEAAFYSIDFRKLIREVLRPSLMDLMGSLWLTSTPGELCSGFFYDVTWEEDEEKRERGWDVFQWTPLDNPGMREQYLAEVAEYRALNPNVEKEPWFRREYLGEYVEDDKGLVYQLGELVDLDLVDKRRDHFVLAVDFGYKQDATAFTVACYSDAHPNFLLVESFKRDKMLVPDIAEEIKQRQAAYPGLVVVGDPASAQLMDELRIRFNVRIIDAEKTEKYAWIKLYNSDVAVHRTKIVKETCQHLIDEQRKLIKLQTGGNQWKEHPGCPNDCCDSALYAYRYCYHHRYRQPAREPEPGSPEAQQKQMDSYWKREAEKLRKQSSRAKRNPWSAITR